MPLINCPDCNTECSNLAQACPKCGRPLGNQNSLVTKDLGFGGAIYALMLIGGTLLAVQGKSIGFILGGAGAILLLVRLKIWTGVGGK